MSEKLPTKEEYIKGAEERVHGFFKDVGIDIPEVAFTAIRVELKTMFEMGQSFSIRELNKIPQLKSQD